MSFPAREELCRGTGRPSGSPVSLRPRAPALDGAWRAERGRGGLPAGRSGRLRAAATALLAALCTGACTDAPQRFEQRLYSMGTWVDVALDAPSGDAAEAALGEIEALLRDFEIDYYAWADGELAELNEALAAGREATVSAGMAALLGEARRLSLQSRGTFDPAVGLLVELWGFHDGGGDPRPAPAAAIDGWLEAGATIRAVSIEERRVRSSVPAVKLDLGGIAKGEAVDRIIDTLRRRGIENAMVDAGGDLRVIGRNGKRPWRIGIRHPRTPDVLAVIELADGEAAFTSGDYERYFDTVGGRMHHIIDPRTGYPAAGTRAVTVVAQQGVRADAAATALLVAGEDWRRVAESMGVETVLRVDASGAVETTGPMRRRLVASAMENPDAADS